MDGSSSQAQPWVARTPMLYIAMQVRWDRIYCRTMITPGMRKHRRTLGIAPCRDCGLGTLYRRHSLHSCALTHGKSTARDVLNGILPHSPRLELRPLQPTRWGPSKVDSVVVRQVLGSGPTTVATCTRCSLWTSRT